MPARLCTRLQPGPPRDPDRHSPVHSVPLGSCRRHKPPMSNQPASSPRPLHPMTSRPSVRLATALTLAVSLLALVVTLLGPAQTLAQTRKTCSTPTGQSKTKRTGRACSQSSHRGKKKRHSRKHHTKPATAKKGAQTSAPAAASVEPARCESGQTPVRAANGTFACSDGSEPECEDGATPTASRKGNTLVCPAPSELESNSSAAECEEEELACETVADEQACETAGADSFSCEAGED
jgi:hypothetical protein